jgi:hypothetical protein
MLDGKQGLAGMLKGIYRTSGAPPLAWVAEAIGESGNLVSEADYRAGGYLPGFDDLPTLKVQKVPVSKPHEPPEEVDREYVEEWMRKNSQRF